ncbi:hypothetical protein BVC80_8171g4 [Macleaya cordata]|uniref:Uncharacterized protein n=1 Tax=Macleaya cordata TaxID=56857 RepID=A0A200QSN6_MACCD|nr:hypothetical protein BVC80_8171g4 [Macleaya cordata]
MHGIILLVYTGHASGLHKTTAHHSAIPMCIGISPLIAESTVPLDPCHGTLRTSACLVLEDQWAMHLTASVCLQAFSEWYCGSQMNEQTGVLWKTAIASKSSPLQVLCHSPLLIMIVNASDHSLSAGALILRNVLLYVVRHDSIRHLYKSISEKKLETLIGKKENKQ